MAATLLLALIAACSGSQPSAPAATPSVPPPTPTVTPAVPEATPLNIGVRGDIPENDPIDLAARYGLTDGRAPVSKPFAGEMAVGDTRDFYVARLSGATLSGREPPETVMVPSTLLARSEHAYFFAEDAVDADEEAMRQAADLFEQTVWPEVTGAFGEPRIAGVDGDPRIMVLQADLGGGAGGYFSSDDEFVRTVRPQSNEAEMVYLDKSLKPGGAAFNVVLAHELQHLIHHRNDDGEESWVNEGLSEAASGLVGGALSLMDLYAGQTDTQLNNWSGENSGPHYGAGASFLRYLAHRFGGDQALGDIARAQADGQAGIDEFLMSTSSPSLRFADVFGDWLVANVLQLDSGPYGNPEPAAEPRITQQLDAGTPVSDTVHQFGADYYALPAGGGDYTLRFTGEASTPVLPAPDGSGTVLWSNRGDSIDSRLTAEVDLRGAKTAALTFGTWFDIEPWYDWGYVSVSTDGGNLWRALTGEHTTTDDPVAVALGPGYYGASGGGEKPAWVDERIDLTPYAGQQVLLRFEYVTDGGTHGEGWALRNLALERDGALAALEPAWDAEGWVEDTGPLEQKYIVRLFHQDGDQATVSDVDVAASGSGELQFHLDPGQQATVVVAAISESTDTPAPYTIELTTR